MVSSQLHPTFQSSSRRGICCSGRISGGPWWTRTSILLRGTRRSWWLGNSRAIISSSSSGGCRPCCISRITTRVSSSTSRNISILLAPNSPRVAMGRSVVEVALRFHPGGRAWPVGKATLSIILSMGFSLGKVLRRILTKFRRPSWRRVVVRIRGASITLSFKWWLRWKSRDRRG